MNHSEPDPITVLRAANPVDVDDLPSASLARIRARVSEDVMATDVKTTRRMSGRVIAGLGAGLVAASAMAFALVLRPGGDAPGLAPDNSSDPGTAACVEQYSPDTLAARTFAFDGTVSAIDGDRVTFTVNEAFQGATESTITLIATGMTGTSITSAGGPNLVLGGRYLVAGDDTFVWACGFTQPYDETVAAEWAAALG